MIEKRELYKPIGFEQLPFLGLMSARLLTGGLVVT